MTRDIFSTVIEKLLMIGKKTGVKIVFMGGIATNIWSRPRVTYDIDAIMILPENKKEVFLIHCKKSGLKYDKKEPLKSIHGMPFLTLVYFKTFVDIFIAKGRFQESVIKRAKGIKFNKKTLYVASCEDLILLKLLSGRNKDMEDIREIIEENKDKIDFKYLKETAKDINVYLFLEDELKSLRLM